MSILSSMSNAISRTFDAIGTAAQATEESLGMATEYVHNRAHSQKLTDKQAVIVDTARTLSVLEEELKADENLKRIYDELEADWG